MGKAIAFLNDKGGVGKSTSAVSLACVLQESGFSVAVFDTDARHSCLDWAAEREKKGFKTPLMIGNSHEGAGMEIKKLAAIHDYVLVDGMSSFVTSNRRDLIASIVKNVDYIFIPTLPNPFDMWALVELTDMVRARQEITDGTPQTWIFGHNVDERTKEWKAFMAHKDEAPFPIMKSFLPSSVDVIRMTGKGLSALDLPEGEKPRRALLEWSNEIKELTR